MARADVVTNQAVTITGGATFGGGSVSFSVGWRFVATQDLTVVSMGVIDADGGGLVSNHTVRIYDVTRTGIVATVAVPSNSAGEAAGGYMAYYVPVTPFVLSNGTTYLIARDKSGDDYRYDSTVSAGPGISFSTGVGYTGNLSATHASFTIIRANSYFGPNFNYAAIVSTNPGTALTEPRSRSVFQRDSNNVAQVRVVGTFTASPTLLDVRAVARSGYKGTSTDWSVLDASPTNGVFSNTLAVAGGWYDLEVRATYPDSVVVTARVERVGVGEVFITCGQSNSGNHGAPQQQPADDRVCAFNLSSLAWEIANDPQPYATGTGGSPWPRFGDFLAARSAVPVAVVAVGVGSTTVGQWAPPGGHFPRLTNAINALKPYGFRAILWHQGESDSLAATAPATYAERLTNIINQTRALGGFAVPWGVAIASFHPSATASNEARVVEGQGLVISNQPFVFKGAETDEFHNRGCLSDTVHFNAAGLRDHGRQWAATVSGALLSADRDGDGIPDLWSFMQFGHAAGQSNDLSRATDDSDGDGVSNADEFRSGTDPNNSSNLLRISDFSLTTNGASIAWDSVPGFTYSLETATGLTAAGWSPLAGAQLVYSNSASHLHTNEPSGPATTLFRVNLQP